MQPFFITSSGTEVGKTLITCTLCWQLKQAGKKVSALKPIISGFDPYDKESDSARILRSSSVPVGKQMLDVISPWQFKAPLAPSMAAKKEGKPAPELDKLVAFCRDYHLLKSDVLLVEGVGGVMAPLNDEHTVLDWIVALNWPVILVVGSYLGSISHSLTALEALRANGLKVAAVVVSESEGSGVELLQTVDALEHFVPRDVPIIKVPRIRNNEEPWKDAPLISWIVEGSHEQKA